LYGSKNELRLTGTHETSKINEFSWGYGDRTASIRCNHTYFEDRRPGSNIDPYIVTSKILKTLMS
jgi:glutamine synthetase